MIVVDLDRTLLRSDKSISDYTTGVLRRCQEYGMKIVFATARSLRKTKKFICYVAIDALIAMNGSIVYCGTKKIAEHIIPEQTKNDVLRELYESNIVKIAAEPENYVYSNHHAPSIDVVPWDFSKQVPEPVYRIFVHHDSPTHVKSIAAHHDDIHLYTVYGEDLFDIDSAEAGKWNAISFLADHFMILNKEVVAFGDDSNDVEMLKNVGIGVAVANAIDEAKAAANCICDTNDNDGVAKWIEENIL